MTGEEETLTASFLQADDIANASRMLAAPEVAAMHGIPYACKRLHVTAW